MNVPIGQQNIIFGKNNDYMFRPTIISHNNRTVLQEYTKDIFKNAFKVNYTPFCVLVIIPEDS
jgi:hypothetical protein